MVGRREFLRVGGLTVVTTAIVAACTDDDGGDAAMPDTSGETADSPSDADIDVLQAGLAFELGALDSYDAAVDSGFITTAAVVDNVELFRTHHEEHSRLLQSVIEDAGADPVTEADTSMFDDLLDELTDEPTALRLMLETERILETTYRASVGEYDDASLNQVAMTVGGVEARHAAVFALALDLPAVQVQPE